MRNLPLLLALSLLLSHVSPSCGDWFYDFDDGIIPDTFMTEGYADLLDTPSETFEASADGGVLRADAKITSHFCPLSTAPRSGYRGGEGRVRKIEL